MIRSVKRQMREERIADVRAAWNNYPDGFRCKLLLAWPELYSAVAHLVRFEEVAEKR